MKLALAFAVFLVGCGSHPRTFERMGPEDGAMPDPDPDPMTGDASLVTPDAAVDVAPPPKQCSAPANKANPMEVVIDPAFAKDYTAYELGLVPGIPMSKLGGCVVDIKNPNALLVAVESENTSGAIYSVPIKREPCGHIVSFSGNATLVATTPYVDANLLYGPNNVMFYSMWPVNKLSELLPMQSSPSYTIDLATIGVGGGGPGGIGFVPPNLMDPGGLRAVTWPDGYWYHLKYSKNGQTYAITNAQQTTTLPNGPGGFGYVPKGSPQFPKQSLITPEWSSNRVVAYDVDNYGDPQPQTRREFINKIPLPWGAYFEPTTGDFIFLSWGSGNDRIYIIEGFTQPPPPPAMPPN